MIGLTLIAGGFGKEIPKGYVYFAMGFSVFVEMINLRVRDRHVKPVNLRDAYKEQKLELQPAVVAVSPAKTVAVKSKSVKTVAAKAVAKKSKPKTKKK
jgi:hypothetical protein